VTGKITAVEPRFAVIELADGIEGTIKAADVSQERVKDATEVVKVGDELEAIPGYGALLALSTSHYVQKGVIRG
jgi:hypothetical protein